MHLFMKNNHILICVVSACLQLMKVFVKLQNLDFVFRSYHTLCKSSPPSTAVFGLLAGVVTKCDDPAKISKVV